MHDGICIDDYFSISGVYCGEWAGATIVKLPLWGEVVSDSQINFEWPTQEDWASMSPDVELQSIEFKKRSYSS